MNLEKYIENVYLNNPLWFVEECNKPQHKQRISKVFTLKNYLNGQHKVKNREDIKYKEEEFIVKKLILHEAKTILNFHSTYLLGNPISLVGEEGTIKDIENVYQTGEYNDIDFRLLDKLVKFGNSYEYVYKDGDIITSKIIAPEDSYPVYSDTNDYIAFIEHWTNIESISYYNVFYEDRVEEWNDEGGVLRKIEEYKNESGLPIVYHTISEEYDNEGESFLNNIIPILDEIEDLLSKMGDSIYTLSLNPLLTVVGQELEGTINKDAVGYSVTLDSGSDMKYVNASMDYNTISLYLNTLHNKLNMLAYMPSIVGGNSNIANVSEVSLKLLYQLADVQAMLNERIMRKGINKRLNVIKKLLGLEGNCTVAFNYSRPQNAKELLDNMKVQYELGAISKRTVIEKSPLTTDVEQELNRINKDGIV